VRLLNIKTKKLYKSKPSNCSRDPRAKVAMVISSRTSPLE
jgi:hypothetical protein